MDLRSIKTAAPNGRNLLKKVLAFLFSVLVMVVSFMIILNSNKAAQDTVRVLRVKPKEGLPAFAALTKENTESYEIIRKEYTDDMILAEGDAQAWENRLVKYYLRGKSVLHQDQLTDDRPLKNDWLYVLESDYEVLTVPYNYLECGGDVLMPGDHVRIRVSYEAEVAADPYGDDSDEDYYGAANARSETAVRTEILFGDIEILDMLNASSHSIYEVYKEVIKLEEGKRQEVMQSKEFLRNIQPRSLLLAGTEEEIDAYARFKSSGGTDDFLITILSRAGSNVVLDDSFQLPTLENEVRSWIETQ